MIQKEILQVDLNLALQQKSSFGYKMEGENLHASGSWKMLKFTSGNGEINKATIYHWQIIVSHREDPTNEKKKIRKIVVKHN